MTQSKIAVGYIHNGTVHAPFMRSMMDFAADAVDRGQAYVVLESQGMFLAANRSHVAETFLDSTDADWLLFVDTDVGFTADNVYALMNHADDEHQIVAGCCFTWLALPDGSQVLGPNWFHVDPKTGRDSCVSEIRQDQLNAISYAGMAFTLIGRTVLSAVRKANADKLAMSMFGHDVLTYDTGQILAGEDITFCARARACGFRVWGAGDVMVDHYKSHKENLQTFSNLYGAKR